MALSSSIYIYVIITLVVLFFSILYQSPLNDDEKSYSVLLPTFVFGIYSCLCRIFLFDFRTSLLFGISVSTVFIILIALYKISDYKCNVSICRRNYVELEKENKELKKKIIKMDQTKIGDVDNQNKDSSLY